MENPSGEPHSKPPRVYQEWEGNEVFFCGGRLVAGPNWKSLFGTSFLILAPLAVYAFLVGGILMDDVSFVVPLIGLLLGVIALIFLFVTGCMDPGILKRQEPDAEYLAGRKPKTNEVMVNGKTVMVRYNETCHFYQPPRAHHCSVNDNCIKKFDHHCPWVGTTIGLRNYRFFLSFIFAASLLCIYICATAVWAIKLEYDDLESGNRDIGSAFGAAPAALVVAGYAVLFFLFVGGLSFFHIYLVSTNQTTYENFRYGHDRHRNPYDEGCFMNCWSVWCIPIPKSEINFRERIDLNPSLPSSTVQTSMGDGSFRYPSKTYDARPPRPQEIEISYRQNYADPEMPDVTTWDPASPTNLNRFQAGSRDVRRIQYLDRPTSAIGPDTDSMEIQVIQPGAVYREEPRNNLRRHHSEGPEVRMFPAHVVTGFRPTTVPNQDGMTPRPRPTTQIPKRLI